MTVAATPSSQGRAAPSSRSRGLSWRLAALAAALLVPLNLFLGLVLWRYAAAEQAAVEARARDAARGLTAAVEREITSVITALEVLATSPHIADGDLAAFHRQASLVAGREGGFHVSLRDAEGTALLSTRLPYGESVPGGTGTLFVEATREAARTGRPAVSGVYVGPLTGKPNFTVSVPVPAPDGKLAGASGYYVNASLDAAMVRQALEREVLPAGWIGLVTDRAGRFVSRSIAHDDFAGRLTSNDFRSKTVGEGGFYYGNNSRDVPVLVGYARSRPTGWIGAVSVPGETAAAPRRRSLLFLVGLGLLLAGGAVTLALLVGRQVSGAVGRLVAAAGRLGRGEPVPAAATGLAETDAVARAIAEAARVLEERGRQREEAEERLRLGAEVAGFGTYDWHVAEDRHLWSAETYRIYGVPEGEALTRDRVWGLIHPGDRERAAAVTEAALDPAGPGTVENEYRVVRPDGQTRWVMTRARVLFTDGDQGGGRRPARMVGAVQDVTERRAAEQALRHLNATLEARVEERTAQLVQLQKIESLGQLTGGVAHDFNNLLMAVTASLELLRKRLGTDDPRITRLLDNAAQGAERGAALTQRLLAFARRQELRPEPVDVAALVRGMADLLASSLGPLVTLETRFPERLRPARADAHQLENALLNLAVNARDAMPGGGSLRIEAREAELGADEPGRLAPGAYVVLSVTDTGEGMDAATLRRAAEPFFTTKGLGKGTGLGLSMVHGLAAQSGGRLLLRSRPGEGTTAELWLPVAEALPARAPSPVAAVPAAEQRSLRVLLVDDDPLVLRGTLAMLEDLGHEPVEAHSGRGALDLVRGGLAADLVITDYAMPGLTGAELAAEVARLRPGLPVLLATGYADLPEGADPGLPRLAKPYRQEALAAAIEAALAPLGREALRRHG